VAHVVTLPAGFAGAMAAAGTQVTGLAVGHGFVTSNIVDIHWTHPADGVTHKSRRGIVVDSSTATSITFNETPAGTGDAYPADATAVIVGIQVSIDTDWDGDLLDMIAVKATVRAMAVFFDATVALTAHYLAANAAASWASGLGVTNPYAGNPVSTIYASNGSIVAGTLSVGVLYRSA